MQRFYLAPIDPFLSSFLPERFHDTVHPSITRKRAEVSSNDFHLIITKEFGRFDNAINKNLGNSFQG